MRKETRVSTQPAHLSREWGRARARCIQLKLLLFRVRVRFFENTSKIRPPRADLILESTGRPGMVRGQVVSSKEEQKEEVQSWQQQSFPRQKAKQTRRL